MKNTTSTLVAAGALGAALGISALTYGLRAAPALAQAIGSLRARQAPPNGGTAADVSFGGVVNQPIARSAFLVTDPGAADGAGAQTVSYGLSDGMFEGRREYAYYGFVRVQAMVRNRRLSSVRVLEYPRDNGTSRYINGIALPYLIQEAVGAQSYQVDLISGATFTSVAFKKSLRDALRRAGG